MCIKVKKFFHHSRCLLIHIVLAFNNILIQEFFILCDTYNRKKFRKILRKIQFTDWIDDTLRRQPNDSTNP